MSDKGKDKTPGKKKQNRGTVLFIVCLQNQKV